jgi:hypothetical protein
MKFLQFSMLSVFKRLHFVLNQSIYLHLIQFSSHDSLNEVMKELNNRTLLLRTEK